MILTPSHRGAGWTLPFRQSAFHTFMKIHTYTTTYLRSILCKDANECVGVGFETSVEQTGAQVLRPVRHLADRNAAAVRL